MHKHQDSCCGDSSVHLTTGGSLAVPKTTAVVEDGCCGTTTQEIKQEVDTLDWHPYVPAAVSFVLLMSGLAIQYWLRLPVHPLILLAVYLIAYGIVGWKTIWKALKSIPRGDVFNEFFLMTIATLGAFAIGEYAEGVAVMLFYEVGELFNASAVRRARKSIQALLDIRPAQVSVMRNNHLHQVAPQTVQPGEHIQARPGERVALDGTLLSDKAVFDTSALTGESRPRTITRGEPVLAGMINLQHLADVQTTKVFEDSALARILHLVQEAQTKKARTQRFISQFAKVYTPIVVLLAVALVLLPYFFVETYIFRDWLYRSLVFLVISCPCALVISIPLGYFGGIGAASRNGVLFKGSNYLDLLTKVDTVVMDKTGTLTEGVFRVQEVQAFSMDEAVLVQTAAALESKSTHPVARAITAYAGTVNRAEVAEVEEIAGHGLRGRVNGQEVLAGSPRLLRKFTIQYPAAIDTIPDTVVAVAINGEYRGYFVIADQPKADARQAVQQLRDLGIRKIVMLSGDTEAVVQRTAKDLGIDEAYGGLLPEDKVAKVEALKKRGARLAFAGDGVNDAPVVALADVGIAMGGLGSDATIETADVVVQTDQPTKIATAIRVSRATRRIVWQNIALAFGVKAAVLALGAWGVAGLWEAVFADVGVALLAILNAIRIQRINFSE
jgi:Zn2+/Cd2+-exporting ATPase